MSRKKQPVKGKTPIEERVLRELESSPRGQRELAARLQVREELVADVLGRLAGRGAVAHQFVWHLVASKRDWTKIYSLIMRWAQEDGTNDDLMGVVEGMGFDMRDPNDFWIEFGERLAKAFGAPDRPDDRAP